MKFADFISPAAIRADLTADDKEGVIREMVKALTEALVRTIGAKPEQVSIIVNELPDQNLAREGKLLSDRT